MIVWPSSHTQFVDWANNLRQLRPDILIQPRVSREEQWKEYANQVVQSSVCQTYQCPRPDGFSDWKEWAAAFIRSFGQNY
jgi:hypothetical protein